MINSSSHFPLKIWLISSMMCLSSWTCFVLCVYSTKFSLSLSLYMFSSSTDCLPYFFHWHFLAFAVPRWQAKGFSHFNLNWPAFRWFLYCACWGHFFDFPFHMWFLCGVSHHMAKNTILHILTFYSLLL